MIEVIKALDIVNTEILVILLALASMIFVVLSGLYLFNRKRFQSLRHQIPATVVKAYLDTVIQNSHAIKSALFRGGGMDLASGIGNLATPTSGGSGIPPEEYNQKLNEIASLRAQLENAKQGDGDIDERLQKSLKELKASSDRIKELENQLKAAKAAGGGGGAPDPQLQANLDQAVKERESLKERLAEYEIIEDDLANLKRLQQENQQLRKALEQKGGSLPSEPPSPGPASKEVKTAVERMKNEGAPPDPLPVAPAPEEMPMAQAPEEEPTPVEEPVAMEQEVAEPEAPAPVEVAAAATKPDAPPAGNDEKTPEDLLSEFEKMLG